jgi:hypothetical protein
VPLDDNLLAREVVDGWRPRDRIVACDIAGDVEGKLVCRFGGPGLKVSQRRRPRTHRAGVSRTEPALDVAVGKPEVKEREGSRLYVGVALGARHTHKCALSEHAGWGWLHRPGPYRPTGRGRC